MYRAVSEGEVDVIAAYTSDGQISTYGLSVLADVKHAIPSYDAILLISPKRTGDGKLIAALKPLVDSIEIAAMREANALRQWRRHAGCGGPMVVGTRWKETVRWPGRTRSSHQRTSFCSCPRARAA